MEQSLGSRLDKVEREREMVDMDISIEEGRIGIVIGIGLVHKK